MPFFQIDDQFPVNRKTRQLVAPVLAGDLRGAAAVALWTLAGASSQASLTDGLLTVVDLVAVMPNPTVVEELACLLVDAELWHGPGHGCEACDPVPVGAWRFHDWWQMRYDRGDVVRTTRKKRAELQKPEVVDAVWARDCTDPTTPGVACCRYCGKTVKRKDTRSRDEDRATLDHVDPTSSKGPRNLVVACKGCNSRKGRRTPQQAGMVLRPAPRTPMLDDTFSPTAAAAETTVSPAALVAETVTASPGPTAAETHVSPVAPAAEAGPSSLGARARVEQASSPPTRPDPDQLETSLETTWSTSPERTPRARDARGAGSGEGSGSGSPQGGGPGAGKGEPVSTVTTSSPDPSRSRRRRRGRGGRSGPQTPAPRLAAPNLDAGPAPDVPVVGQFGSPWHGWHGPPSPLGDEHHCDDHHLPFPCRKCEGASA